MHLGGSRLLCAAGTARSSRGVTLTRSTSVLVLARVQTPRTDSIALARVFRGPASFLSTFLESGSGCSGVRAGSAGRYGNRSHDDFRTQRVCPTARSKTKSNPRTMHTGVSHAWDSEAATSVASWKTLVRFAADISWFTSLSALGPIQGRGRRMVAQAKTQSGARPAGPVAMRPN